MQESEAELTRDQLDVADPFAIGECDEDVIVPETGMRMRFSTDYALRDQVLRLQSTKSHELPPETHP